MDLAVQRYAHLKFDLKFKRPTCRTGVPKSRIQKRTSDSCSATPKTQGIPRFQKLIRIFVTMATPGSRLVRDFEISSLKKFDFTAKHLVAGGIRTCTFIVKNREHYHSAMMTSSLIKIFYTLFISILNQEIQG